MRTVSHKLVFLRERRRQKSLLALVAYLCAIVGVPLPTVPKKVPSTERYPCQGNPCGCRSAYDCWTNCCCTTPEQRFAWAEANNVTPPEYATRSKTNSSDRTQRECCQSGTRSCRSDGEGCENSDHPESNRDCPNCQRGRGEDAQTNSNSTPKPNDSPQPNPSDDHSEEDLSEWTWVVGISALRCQGHNPVWVFGEAAAIASLDTSPLVPRPHVLGRVPLENRQISSMTFPPPIPPPRFLASGLC